MFSKHKKNKEGHGISSENFNTTSVGNISSLWNAGMLFMWGCNKEGHGVCLEKSSTALGAYIPKFWQSIILFPKRCNENLKMTP